MSERYWPCPHIYTVESSNSKEWYRHPSETQIGYRLTHDVFFCDRCAAKRPEPVKSLAEKLREAYRDRKEDYCLSGFQAEAECALEHFLGVVEKAGEYTWHTDVLKQAMRDSIGRVE